KMMEPPENETVSETYTRSDGSTGTREVTRETSAHQMWASQYAAAQSMATLWSSRAESYVNDANRSLPALREALSNADIKSTYLDQVNGAISWFFGGWASFGFWSFDYSDCSRIEGDLNRLHDHLARADAVLSPAYEDYNNRVWGRINQRRGELLAM